MGKAVDGSKRGSGWKQRRGGRRGGRAGEEEEGEDQKSVEDEGKGRSKQETLPRIITDLRKCHAWLTQLAYY